MYGGSDERDVYRECQCRYSRGEGEVGWFRLLGHVICVFCINFELDLEHPCRCVGVFDQEGMLQRLLLMFLLCNWWQEC